MISPKPDHRSAARRALDEKIAAEPPLSPPPLPSGVQPAHVEALLANLPHQHPIAVVGIVQNGAARPVDPNVKLAEHSRVIIVTTTQEK